MEGNERRGAATMPISPLSPSISSSSAPGFFSSASDGSDDLLLCGEDAGSFSDDDHRLPLCYLHCEDANETGSLASVETAFSLGLGYRKRFDAMVGSLDSAARRVSAAWILKVGRPFIQGYSALSICNLPPSPVSALVDVAGGGAPPVPATDGLPRRQLHGPLPLTPRSPRMQPPLSLSLICDLLS